MLETRVPAAAWVLNVVVAAVKLVPTGMVLANAVKKAPYLSALPEPVSLKSAAGRPTMMCAVAASLSYGTPFPLLADTDKAVGQLYGTLGPIGFYRRSVFVVDAQGVVRVVHELVAHRPREPFRVRGRTGLVAVDPQNEAKFKDVLDFLRQNIDPSK